MGRPTGAGGGPPPPEPPGGPADGTLAGLLGEIRDLLQEQFGLGQSDPRVIVLSLTTGGTFDVFPSVLVKRALIQNISVEDVTIVQGPNGTAGSGILLNAASAAGEGGGSMPTGNVNLARLGFVRVTAGATLAVYYEQ